MANISNMYNPEAEASTDFSPIPTGEYPAMIVDSDMKQNGSNTGQYLELVHEISSGEFKGRKIWANLNLDNPSQQAVEIANRDMASIREATGVSNPTDSQQLHYKPVVIRVEFIPAGTVKTSKNGKTYEYKKDTNEIKVWKKPAAGTAATGTGNGAQQAAPAQAAASNDSTPPWKRNQAA